MRGKILLLLLLLLFSYASGQINYDIPYKREMRAVWISTVKMLDYPSRRNLSSEELKQEYVRLLDTLHKLNINTVIFQIRPAADAFFDSPYEPWSEWLTGKQGRAPQPYFDPLKFYIEEAHKRHMQFHAWINPFRAIATIAYADVIPSHISRTHPQWCFDYGLHRYFNPGIPQVRAYILKIIADIVRRYDIDGIHFDDYFYPYPVRDANGKIIPIPDYQTFRKYGKDFNTIAAWRRHNITEFIRAVHDTVKAIKPWVIFGVSPNAIWRNHSRDPRGSTTKGLAAYDWLYADILLWDSLKLVDYIAPQLYFPNGHRYADFATLLQWWSSHIKNANLIIGLNILGIDNKEGLHPRFSPAEFMRQLSMAQTNPRVKGIFLYRMKTLMHNPFDIDDSLKTRAFRLWALFPRFPYSDTTGPSAPHIDHFRIKDTLYVVWGQDSLPSTVADSVLFYSVYITKITDTAIIRDTVLLTQEQKLKVIFRRRPLRKKDDYIIQVCSWDRYDNRSNPSYPLVVEIPKGEAFKIEVKKFEF